MAPRVDAAVATGERRSLALMRRIRGEDREALEELFSLFWEPLVDYANGFVSCVDDAEDIVQKTFIAVWEKRTRWESRGTVTGFLYRVTRNIALNEQRRRRIRRKWLDRLGPCETLCAPDTGETIEESRLRDVFEEAVEALPSRRREIFILASSQKVPHRDIAQSMGISPQTVANQMHTALRDLRRSLVAVLPKECEGTRRSTPALRPRQG